MNEIEAGRLISGYFDDTLTDQEVAELDALLLADADCVSLFSRLAILHSAIREAVKIERSESEDIPGATQADTASDPGATLLGLATSLPEDTADEAMPAPAPAPIPLIQPRRMLPGNLGRRTALAAAILLMAGTVVFLLLHRGAGSPEPIAMGPSLDAIWVDPASVPAPGNLFEYGASQSLKSGYAELTSANGLIVVIAGPATFTVEKAGVVSLTSGKLTASVPKPARGFTVNTPVASIVDLGTEFGVSVDASGQTDVQTFRGTVSVSSTVSSAASSASLITAGIARHVGSSGDITEIPADSTTFVRPAQFDDWNANGTPYQHWKAYSQRLCSDPDLVAYYTFDESSASPDRLLNLAPSGSALDGVLGGTEQNRERPVWTTGRWPEKGALSFGRNSHQKVEIPAVVGGPLDFSRGEQTAAPFTICVWFRSESPQSKDSSIALRGGGIDRFLAIELLHDASIRGWVGNSAVQSPPSSTNGQWQHMALSYDPQHGKLELYLNGVLVAANTAATRTLQHTGPPLAIGNREFNPVAKVTYLPPMAGRIDEFAIFKRAMTAEEVQDLYQAENPE